MRSKITTLLLCLAVAACGPSPSDPDGGGDDDGGGSCVGSETRCQGATFQMCVDGQFENQEHCPALCPAEKRS